MQEWIAGLHQSMAHTCNVLLISGSLRSRSTSSAVLKTAVAVAPEGIEPAMYEELGHLPPFNPDDDQSPLDPAVSDLRGRIRAADAVLLSTPEYAGALPGSFKNLLDWTIGDDEAGSIYEKPVAWINASPRGAIDAHESLRKVLGYANVAIVESACIRIEVSTAMLDDDGLIRDDDLRHRIAGALMELVAHGCPEDAGGC